MPEVETRQAEEVLTCEVRVEASPASAEARSSTVEVQPEPDGEATVVRLLHRDLPAEHVPPHELGWSHYLGRLAVAAPGGDAGPDVAPEDRR